jgi:hypothetical protein
VSTTFKDNSKEVLEKLRENEILALTEIGLQAVEVVTDYLETMYGKPIRITGDLIRDVNFEVKVQDKKVVIGNSLNYAIPVHEGHGSLKGRPYLKDAITQNVPIWQETAARYLGEGFGKIHINANI